MLLGKLLFLKDWPSIVTYSLLTFLSPANTSPLLINPIRRHQVLLYLCKKLLHVLVLVKKKMHFLSFSLTWGIFSSSKSQAGEVF